MSLEFLDDYLESGFGILKYVFHVILGKSDAPAGIRLNAHAVDKYRRTLAILVVRIEISLDAVVILGRVIVHLLAFGALVAGDLRVDDAVIVLFTSACICIGGYPDERKLCSGIALDAESTSYAENAERSLCVAFLCLPGTVKADIGIAFTGDLPGYAAFFLRLYEILCKSLGALIAADEKDLFACLVAAEFEQFLADVKILSGKLLRFDLLNGIRCNGCLLSTGLRSGR